MEAAPPPAQPIADSRSLSEILRPVIAEREREAALALPIQQLQFFHNELQHMASLLKTTPGAGRVVGAQGVLESILDTIAEFNDFIVTRFGVPQRSVAQASDESIEAPVAVPWDTFPGQAEREAYLLRLQIDLEAILDELRAIRESLAGNEMLLDLLSQGEERHAGVVRDEMIGIYATLAEILQECIKALSEVPGEAEGQEGALQPTETTAAAAPGAVPAPAPHPPEPLAPRPPSGPAAAPALSVPRHAPPLPGLLPAATVPAGQRAPADAPAAQQAAQAPPTEAAAAAPGGEATGLALSPAGDGSTEQAEPVGPDYTHRSEEEAIHVLQDFFNENSPEAFLVKSLEPEFERMTRQLLMVACPGVTFSDMDFATRLRRLRDTFALRKKLHNTLTYNEFKAYFRQTR